MGRVLLFTFLLMTPRMVIGQHIPPCAGVHHDIGHSICYAYAQGRAFEAQWDQGECHLETFFIDYIDTDFFERISMSMPDDIKLIQAGDILEFGSDHFAYVTTIGAQTETPHLEHHYTTADIGKIKQPCRGNDLDVEAPRSSFTSALLKYAVIDSRINLRDGIGGSWSIS